MLITATIVLPIHLIFLSNNSGVSRTEGQRVLFFDETVSNWAIILETYNTMSCMELQKVCLHSLPRLLSSFTVLASFKVFPIPGIAHHH
jgi:hypothetical protein